MRYRAKTLVWVCGLVVGLTGGAWGQPAAPQLSKIHPNTVQRSAEVHLVASGARLSGVTRADVRDATGVTTEVVNAEADKVTLKVSVTANADLGPRELRLVGPHGVSQPVSFYIAQYPVLTEVEPNGSTADPHRVDLPAVLLGSIAEAGDADVFAFEARAGQRLIVEAHAAREGSMLDPVVTLTNVTGREVAASNDHFDFDSFISYAVPSSGMYFLSVRDLKYRGGEQFTYRLTAGPIPYIEAIFPIAGRQGQQLDVTPIGYNLSTSSRIKMDLAGKRDRIDVRASVDGFESNALPIEVVAEATIREAEPNDDPQVANALTLPATINGRIDRAGDEDVYSFSLDRKQKVAIEAFASRYGSPVDPLLTLRNEEGEVLERNDDAAGHDAKIERQLGPGRYTVALRDLLYGSGPRHVYRLSVGSDVRAAQDFAIRFMPDTLRISRGGHSKVWAEVVRTNGYKGEVTVGIEGLPKGVTIDPAPAVLAAGGSGVFTLSAATDAEITTAPIKLWAVGSLGDSPSLRTASPQIGKSVVQQAYVTIFEPAPFAIRPIALSSEQLTALSAERDAIKKKLVTPTPELAAATQKWEESLADKSTWIVLDPEHFVSTDGSTLTELADRSILAGGKSPPTDRYNVITHTSLKKITGVKLEVLPDPSLPRGGPGRANGNFILSEFRLAAAKRGDWGASQPIKMQNAKADFQQNAGLAPSLSIDYGTPLGWAIGQKVNEAHWATFEAAEPIENEEGSTLIFTLAHLFPGTSLNIGRFRLLVTDDEQVRDGPNVNPEIAEVLATNPQSRSEEQKTKLVMHYMSFAEEFKADRARLAVLENLTASSFPPVANRNDTRVIAFAVNRMLGFAEPVKVTLEGFAEGRDPKTGEPLPASVNLTAEPVSAAGSERIGLLSFKPVANAPADQRNVVLRAEAKVGDVTYVQYSPAFPLTVKQ